ncbi:MAG: protease modulator HflC [Verrucomicrobiota bacterium]
MSIGTILKLAVALLALMVLSGSLYQVSETDQVILTQFGKPLEKPVTTAGLHFKVPFIQEVNRIEKRVLQWDGPLAEMPTKDKLYITIDAFGRWRIKDPLTYLLRLRDERSAQSRLDDILGSEMRNTVARHELVELIRTTKERVAELDATTFNASGRATAGLPPIRFGRLALEEEIASNSRDKLADFGIELLDVRFKRVNYKPEVTTKIFERMISERRQIAERYRSEGAGEAAKILGAKERDLKEIESVAYRTVQGVEGKADAEASRIYAQAYNQSPDAREFYGFTRALETYRTTFSQDTTLVLTTESSFLRYFKGDPGPQSAAPAALPVVPPPGEAPAPSTTP